MAILMKREDAMRPTAPEMSKTEDQTSMKVINSSLMDTTKQWANCKYNIGAAEVKIYAVITLRL